MWFTHSSALLSQPSQPFEIYAVTRDKTSRGARALAKRPNVHIIQGDFDHPNAIFQQVEKPWGLFSVTNPIKGAKVEENQGKAMTKEALVAGYVIHQPPVDSRRVLIISE
jgi:hypothetical protein